MAKPIAGETVLRREALLNDAFIRSFRDTGDGDYVAARLVYRARLIPQFHWSSLQAIEKYLKCILALNRVEAKTGHDLAAALDQIRRKVRFQLRLSESTQQFIDHLDTVGRFRYLETPYYEIATPLIQLDRAVWEIRRYCQCIDYSRVFEAAEAARRYDCELGFIEAAESRPPNKFAISGGFLEEVLRHKQHPARPALVWKNFFYSAQNRRQLTVPSGSISVNSPLSLHPDLLDEMLKYVQLPAEVKRAYRAAPKVSASSASPIMRREPSVDNH